jgi:tRNA threonylcarbamoyl adenosine modification protein (Sua5/YciO/YrdC/YwlC family)
LAGALYLRLNEDNPEPSKLIKISAALQDGAIIGYPTDTAYGLGCCINKPKSFDRIARIKETKTSELRLSIVFDSLQHLSDYTRPIPTSVYRILKKLLPGAYTFIIEANNKVPKVFNYKRTHVGIRIPDNAIARAIVTENMAPIVTTSAPWPSDDYSMDPAELYDQLKDKVDVFIDGGYCNNLKSSVIEVSSEGLFNVIREGAGDVSIFG